MSTIEKAASRLASRKKTNVEGSRREASGSLIIEPIEMETHGALAQAESRGRLHPQRLAGHRIERFCDIDLEDLLDRGFLVPDAGRTRLAQEMRRIKRPLLLTVQKAAALVESGKADGQPPANLIMVTSALPGEGKTFTAINLAMSLSAEVDRRVLLVDADVARGDVSRQLGLKPARGLCDLLQETNYLFEDGVMTSNVERLSILPSGSSSGQIDELFASDMMHVVTRSLAEADPSRIVVFDAPPLLATTEAAVLARHMGQTVMVVEASRTPQDAVNQAISQLEGCANVSLMLNKTSGKDNGTYGYGYGSYGAYGSDADAITRQREPAVAS